jgi:hypothetical protein
MYPLIPAEMVHSGLQLMVYFVTVLAAVLSFLVSTHG